MTPIGEKAWTLLITATLAVLMFGPLLWLASVLA